MTSRPRWASARAPSRRCNAVRSSGWRGRTPLATMSDSRFMKTKTIAAAATIAALAMPAAAGATKPADAGSAKNQNAPGQACKAQSKKKAEGQKKSAFAACVSGFKKQQAAEQKAATTET